MSNGDNRIIFKCEITKLTHVGLQSNFSEANMSHHLVKEQLTSNRTLKFYSLWTMIKYGLMIK